ncbi:MAG: DNA integrity scanning protein DisA [Clostridia bacterium]|nr:DNA integrity scanning protein DisA [Clostridia bacterium]
MSDDADWQRVRRLLAPGTVLREAIDSILGARMGALVVVGGTPQVLDLVEGGFFIDCELTPARLYELAKMDGAILVSGDLRRILYANVELVPDPRLPSQETGVRHRTAERVARQTNAMVIAVSQRRHQVSVYVGDRKRVLRDPAVVLAKANQALQALEKARSAFDLAIEALNALEFEDAVTLSEVAAVLRRSALVRRIGEEIAEYVEELGTEGRLVEMQLHQLLAGVQEEEALVVRDYCHRPEEAGDILELLTRAEPDGLVEPTAVARLLGFAGANQEMPLSPRGFRLLRKIPRLPPQVVENLVDGLGSLQRILEASVVELDDVEGIGEARANAIKEGLRRIRSQVSPHRPT